MGLVLTKRRVTRILHFTSNNVLLKNPLIMLRSTFLDQKVFYIGDMVGPMRRDQIVLTQSVQKWGHDP